MAKIVQHSPFSGAWLWMVEIMLRQPIYLHPALISSPSDLSQGTLNHAYGAPGVPIKAQKQSKIPPTLPRFAYHGSRSEHYAAVSPKTYTHPTLYIYFIYPKGPLITHWWLLGLFGPSSDSHYCDTILRCRITYPSPKGAPSEPQSNQKFHRNIQISHSRRFSR